MTEAAIDTTTTTDAPSYSFDDFKSALPETLSESFNKNGVKDFESLDKHYNNLNSLIGKKGLIKPDEGAAPEAVAEYNKKLFAELGVPQDGVYNVPTPEGWGEGNGITQDILDGLATMGVEKGLTPAAYEGVLGLMNETASKLKAQSAEMFGTAEALAKEWGNEAETNSKLAEQFVENNMPEAKALLELPVFKKFALELAKKTGDDTLRSGEVNDTTKADLNDKLNDLTRDAIAARNSGDYKLVESLDRQRQAIMAKL
jgi:hypothetical protein